MAAESSKDGPSDVKGTVSLVTLVEEEATFLGRIPLDKFKAYLEKKAEEGIVTVDFHANGYITDAVLKVLLDVLCNKAKKDKYLAQLTTIDLTGCFNVTDTGIGWLAKIIKDAPKVKQVCLNACVNVTDAGLAGVINARPSITVSAIATSVTRINLDLTTQGCPLLIDPKYNRGHVELLFGHCLIVPHSGLENSFADYLSNKAIVSRSGRQLCHVKNWNVKDWSLALNEMELSNPLFDVLVPSNPSQVLIPFDAATDLKEIRSHVADTITRVLNKETIKPPYLRKKVVKRNTNKFMDIHQYIKLDISSDGILKHVSSKSSVTGFYASRQPLSRKNPYYEVSCIKCTGTSTNITYGCMFDAAFKQQLSSVSTSGMETSTERLMEGDVLGFGIKGKWKSEYVPKQGESCFYLVKNGDMVLDYVPNNVPCVGMYPYLCVSGTGETDIRLDNFNTPPKDTKKEKVKFVPACTDWVQCDEEGILTLDVNDGGQCLNKLPITKSNSSCTIRILEVGVSCKMSIGLGRENVVSRKVLGMSDDTLALHAEDGKIYFKGKPVQQEADLANVEARRWKKDDVVTISVSGFDEDLNHSVNNIKVEFSIGKSKVAECEYNYVTSSGSRCVFMIGLHSKGEKVKIENFGRPYYSQPPVMDRLTMGRGNSMKILDDGTLTLAVGSNTPPTATGFYMSKTAINKSLTYFEMEVIKTFRGHSIFIGLGTWNHQYDKKLGTIPASIGYDGNTAKVYNNADKGTQLDTKLNFNEGDIIGCGIDMSKAKFTSDGKLQSHQLLDVYFSKNGVKVHETTLSYHCDGLYPCVSLTTSTYKVKLKNFYPGCFMPGYQPQDDKPEESEKVTKEEMSKLSKSEGCQFVLVSVGSGKGDEKAKLEQVKSQLNLGQDLIVISKLKTEIQRLEKDLGSLDFQGQNYYSRLCWNLECLQRICDQKDRIHFLSVNTTNGEGYDGLLDEIVSLHEGHKCRYPYQYKVPLFVKQGLDTIVNTVASKLILCKADDIMKKHLGASNHVFPRAINLLHGMGRVLCLKLNFEVYAVDLSYLVKSLFEKVDKKPNKKGVKDKRVTVVGENTQLWTLENFLSASNLVLEAAEVRKYLAFQMGLLKLTMFRNVIQDPLWLYIPMKIIEDTNVNMSDYWSGGSRPADTVMMWRTYQFLAGMPTEMLSTIITLCSQYSRLLLVRKDGGVLQNGAVQTVIVKHTTDKKADALTIESKCYVPDSDMGPINDDTRYHVEEYTWNVFCILADVIDGHIENCGLCPIIKQEVSNKFGNKSIGCRHEWDTSEAEIVQSVCTLCEMCCLNGSDCKWNGIVGNHLRQCQCGTKVSGCKSCGICKRCAEQLWTLRSLLRPCCDVTENLDSTDTSNLIALNGRTYNQVTLVKLHQKNQPICLKRQGDTSETLIQVFPGTATECIDLKKFHDYNKKNSFKGYQSLPGDTVTITLKSFQKDPDVLDVDEKEEEAVFDIKPVYNASVCLEARVWHETGIVCYDTLSNKVGQFIAAKPLTADCNKFTIEIMSPGRQTKIGIGLVNKEYPVSKQPGLSGTSFAYHADNGGIYLSSSTKSAGVDKATTGDMLTCELDVAKQTISFYKGQEKLFTTEKVKFPPGGFFPMVGLASDGESVRLVDLDPWLPLMHGEAPPAPETFDTYKYGNLWISPGSSVYLHKTAVSKLAGWLLLHNPSSDLVGYVISSDPPTIDVAGQIEPDKSSTVWLSNIVSSSLTPEKIKNGTIEVIWFNLASGKTYSTKEIKDFLKNLTSEQYHGHLLKIKIDTEKEKEWSTLRKTSSGMSRKDRYELQVKLNDTIREKYYLKAGNYVCVLPPTGEEEADEGSGTLLVRRPKHPTYDLINGFQRGMRVVAQPDKKGYSECVISSCSSDIDSVTLEFSPKDSDDNETLDVKPSSKVIQLENVPMKVIAVEEPEEQTESKDTKEKKSEEEKKVIEKKKFIKKADIEIQGYEARDNVSVEKRAYMFPPLYLLTPASKDAIIALDSKWKTHSLDSIGKCDSVPTRITVQELQITELSRKLPNWVKGKTKDCQADQAFVFLPSSLDSNKLCYSPVPKLFQDIEVHRLCFLVEQLHAKHGMAKILLDIPLHFVNTPPIKPQSPVPVSLMYGSLFSGWTYTVLITKKLKLPVYDKVFSGGKPDCPKPQVEAMLRSLLRVYTAQCHILAEQYGGMDLQEFYPKYSEEIEKQISHSDKHVQLFNGKLFDDPSSLIKHQETQLVFCKGHQLNMDRTRIWDQDQAKELLYEHKHFEPYNEMVNYFHREMSEQQSLPKDFFSKFPDLQFFCLEGCEKLTSLPDGISKCGSLKGVVLKNGVINHLPEDIFLVPEMEVLNITKLPITTLPGNFDWPASKKLTKLSLSGLQMTKVPPELSKLKELTHLDLSCNPLVDIPHELRKLQKLKVLDLSGMPWLTVTSNRSSITRDQYRTWCKAHPYIHTYLNKMDMEQLFEDHDLNRNWMLDEEELSAFNLKLFWAIPRLGSNCITDEEFGGIPPAVFQMASLEELSLMYTAVTVIPVHMCRLVNLRTLRLENNPLIESLPGSVGHMPNLKHLSLGGCPSLRTPPSEVVSRGFESVKAYLKRLAGGFTACRRTKLMLVGLGGAGKTSLLKALMSQNKKTAGTKGEGVTDGIVIQHWKVATQDGHEISYSAWDFAGQTLYYNTHQFFLSKRAVYLLLWSTRQGFEHAGLEFWLSSIACHAPKTPIFVVGTHCDEVPKADIPMAELTQTYPQIAGFHFVSSTAGTGIAKLEKNLLKVTLEQKNMGEKIPQVWLNLEKKILAAREKTSILPWSVVKEHGVDVGLYDEKDNKEAIEFLHELGTVQYFDNEFLRDRVVINPQWIVNVMSCVVSVKNSPIQEHKGQLYHKHIGKIWKEYPASLHQWLLQLTEEFDLTFPLPKDPVNIVPCLLPQEEPKELDWPAIPKNGNVRQTKMVYKFSYLPAGLFNRAQVRLFQFSDGKHIWKRGSLLKKNNHLALIRQISNFELVVLVQGPRPENILFLIHEVFESLIDESFHGVVYDFMVPCPDCVMKEGCLEPSLFDSQLVYTARDHKAPFLQCRKYFHAVSMSQLIESMPDAQGGDFDASLQHSIMMLQELNSALTTDVAVLYSMSDVPKSKDTGDRIHPVMVKNDLQKAGLSVWFCEDMNKASIQDLTLGLKNCKVVVALVSDNFERDEKCHGLMLYTMNVLHKSYVIMATGNNMSWQNTDLGMRIGKQELMVMAKTKTRYVERVKELQSMVAEKIQGVKTKSKEYPVCFISYCWCNSQAAVSLGTRERPGSLGWGDPRTLKRQLEDAGISTWIDHEQMVAGKGLFENITQGMRYAKVLVACVSDEYAESENCMMELRFGVLNLGLPLVLAVVGTGNEWLYTEAAALAQRAKAERVHLQEQSSTAYKTLIKHVRDRLPEKSDVSMRKEALKQDMTELQKKSISSQTSVVFQEEYELTQRRFMRHIISFVSSMDSTPMPRLVVIDFDKAEQPTKVTDSPARKPGQSRPTMRPKTASRTRDRIEMVNPEEEDWESENLCIKILCEFEEGWHLCEQVFPLRKSDEFHNHMKKVAPYLARIFSILKQSSMQLNCFSGDAGKKFLDWLEKESQGSDFLEAYQAMRGIISEHEQAATSFLNQLSRCQLPSGKVFWLCEKHQSGPRVTKLSRDVGTRLHQRKMVLQADVLLKEQIEKSDIYNKKKTEKCTVKKMDYTQDEDPKPAAKTSKTNPPEVKPSAAHTPKQSDSKPPPKPAPQDKSEEKVQIDSTSKVTNQKEEKAVEKTQEKKGAVKDAKTQEKEAVKDTKGQQTSKMQMSAKVHKHAVEPNTTKASGSNSDDTKAKKSPSTSSSNSQAGNSQSRNTTPGKETRNESRACLLQ